MPTRSIAEVHVLLKRLQGHDDTVRFNGNCTWRSSKDPIHSWWYQPIAETNPTKLIHANLITPRDVIPWRRFVEHTYTQHSHDALVTKVHYTTSL